ncbi:uncharacterized protein LOC133196872 [Saccostrea echinata]|uniref:uncharacterized protein LOC133196872 n=1 Tax=Saccostrea echinata TaxID=191078 RepID=UPI002A804072|nr:uncharacterized protein LOC133196872 [Saccostrea echinata]
MKLLITFLLGCCILLTKAFLPSKESTSGRPDYTHASITQAGIYYAVADVIADVINPGKYNSSDPDGTIMNFFDRDGLIHFAKTVVDIVNKNNMAQRNYMDDASRTMNCEQIVSGHLLLQSLRDNIVHQSQTANPNWDAVRDLIGQYLFTLQEFYSNTNWVEMFGNRVCRELGVSGQSLPYKVSDPNMVACVNCNYSKEAVKDYSCVDNMRSDGQLLTSGYTSYQHINKPIGNFPSGMGKCSHGGPYDMSKDIPATGGINKETSSPELSPHFDLHQQAGQAAIQATYEFFIGNGTGLLSILGIDRFKEMLGMTYKNPCYNCLAPGLSVVFVIDDTGSMSGEIREATQHSIDIVNQASLLGSNGPSNYILSTFNDPDTTIHSTTDGSEMKQWLHAMVAHGGGDCPEMAMAGIVNALKMANPGSCVFFFTDADAKDPEKANEVINLVNSKHMKLVYFLRGDCDGRRRRSVFNVPQNVQCIPNENKRRTGLRRRSLAGLDLFDKIASATGGQIVHTSSTSLGSILGTFVEKNMGVSTLEVTSFETKPGSMHTITADSELSLMTVKIEILSNVLNVKLDRPDGSVQQLSNSSVDVIGRTTVLSIPKPTPGKWTLHNNDVNTWIVKVGGSGKIDFTFKFMENILGLMYPISGTNPITGSKVVISISITGIPSTARVTDIILRKPSGTILNILPVKDTSTNSQRDVYAYYDVTSEEFYVSINGSINSEIFTREKSNVIKPVTGNIKFSSKPETLVLGKTSAIKVNVTNTGSTSQTYQVTATSVPTGFVIGSSQIVSVGAHKSQEKEITLTAPNLTIATLSIKLKISGNTLQTIMRTLTVTALPPPEITQINRTADCRQEVMNYLNCSQQTWSVSLDVEFKAHLSKLYVTPSEIEFIYVKKTTTSSTYVATLRGNCCSYISKLTAIDKQGNMKMEPVNLSGGHLFNTTVENIDLLQKPPVSGKINMSNKSELDYNVILELIGAGTACLIVVVVIVMVAWIDFLSVHIGNDELENFVQTVQYIVDKNNMAQKNYMDDAVRTMNCEQIAAGHLLLQSLKESIIHKSQGAKTNGDAIRDLIGQYLFTIQEFYSNTNWVEMFGNHVCKELGKCPLDNSKAIPGNSGINKETSSPELSPHYYLHQQAGEDATQATIDFLVGHDTGLLSILGLDTFRELMGMNYRNPCYDCLASGLSVVFHDTGCISEDIKMASQQRFDAVNQTLIRERNRRGFGGIDLFEKIASATGGQIVHTSSSSLGSILGAFVTKNMGVSSLEVTSFEMSTGSVHSLAVDTDLSLMTVRIEGLSSASQVSLDRPDGTSQIFSGTSSVDVIGSTTVISVKNPPSGRWKLHKNGAGTWKVKFGGSGNIDFTYKFMEDVHGIQYPISGTSPITGSKITISVTVNGLPATARVTDIILKKPDGTVLNVIPVKDTYSGTSRVLYANYIVTSQEFFVSINGSLNSNVFTREKADIVTPVTGSIQFSSKPEKLVLGKSTVVKVNITNTGSTTQAFRVTATSVPTGFVSSSPRSISVGAHRSQEMNIGVTSKSNTLAGTCCSYLSRVTAVDVRSNMKSESFDFSGGNVFNTTVDNFELLVKASPSLKKENLPSGVDKTLLYGLIGGGLGGLCIIAVVLATLIHVNKSQRLAMEKNAIDSLSSVCFDAPLKHVERNSRSKFVLKT